MSLQFTTLDVFTTTAFEGNPLAVVTIPPPSQLPPLTQNQKQRIAREFNLSETVFIHDVEDRDATNERQINIFTPDRELPFAGHPTIGTALFLKSQGVKTMIAKAGRLEIEFQQDGSARVLIPHNVRLHKTVLPQPGYEAGADDKLIKVAEAEKGARLFSIVQGMTFALVELPSLDLLGAAKIGAMSYISGDLQDDGWKHDFDSRRYYFVLLNSEISADGKQFVQNIRTRLVKLSMEDPATGSAACALSCYSALHKLSAGSIRFQITQGVEMGRESLIVVDVEVETGDDGERMVKSVHLSGRAVEVMKGTVRVPSVEA
ncbi:phenazine biosynthesis protein [Fusarium austroafricanum]|uniref:Phenazine biosynthesis protein n=1 Tax=Fusarium austroafricanum TaxID=2364996 RepID=A0A8H4NZW9_9HYPO|nr:phenazine biosynthesis protein [Fusarium austroafricanum]